MRIQQGAQRCAHHWCEPRWELTHMCVCCQQLQRMCNGHAAHGSHTRRCCAAASRSASDAKTLTTAPPLLPPGGKSGAVAGCGDVRPFGVRRACARCVVVIPLALLATEAVATLVPTAAFRVIGMAVAAWLLVSLLTCTLCCVVGCCRSYDPRNA
jgi:hypothetical protein